MPATETTEPTEDAVQPALPSMELPEFDGLVPVGVLTTLTGAGQRVHRAIQHGAKVVLLIEAEVTDVRHPKTKEGVKRKHVLSVVDLFEVEGKAGQRILATMRQQYRSLDDARHGRSSLPFPGEGPRLTAAGWIDASGNVLTAEDVAEIQGTRLLASANDGSLDPLVLVFVDGGTLRWPDEFGPEPGERPSAGTLMTDGGSPRLVREVRDVDGFVLGSLSDDEVEKLLADLDVAERAEAAAGDAEAVDELLSARAAAQEGAPWPDFDSFTVPQLRGLIGEMTEVDEIRGLLAYEQAHKKRTSVLGAASARLAEVEA